MDNMQSLYPSLYAKYLTERTDDKIIEEKEGFVTYRYINDHQVYIVDIYILPEWRKHGIASRMADTVCAEAKLRCCTQLIGTVNPSCKGANESILTLLSYGMSVESCTDNIIVFKKDI